MNTYHWITIILIANIVLILFVRGADERRNREPKRREAWKPQ
jgi:hypothetical protein